MLGNMIDKLNNLLSDKTFQFLVCYTYLTNIWFIPDFVKDVILSKI